MSTTTRSADAFRHISILFFLLFNFCLGQLERSASLVQDPESGIVRKNAKKSATHITMRILMQAFTMTFLAEWGDRSQLTTIILAASKVCIFCFLFT